MMFIRGRLATKLYYDYDLDCSIHDRIYSMFLLNSNSNDMVNRMGNLILYCTIYLTIYSKPLLLLICSHNSFPVRTNSSRLVLPYQILLCERHTGVSPWLQPCACHMHSYWSDPSQRWFLFCLVYGWRMKCCLDPSKRMCGLEQGFSIIYSLRFQI
jgi:hypothetical protein